MRFVLLYDHVIMLCGLPRLAMCKSIPFFLSFRISRALTAYLSIFHLSLSLFFLFTSRNNNAT